MKVVLHNPSSGPLTIARLSELSISLERYSERLRDEALFLASAIEMPTDAETAELCARHIRELKELKSSTEAARQALKRPVLDLGNKVDAVAREFITPVDLELSRLQRLINAFTSEQRRIEAEAARKQQEESDRLERERQKLREKEFLAATPAQVARVEKQVAKVESQQAAVAVLPPAPIKVAASQTRSVPKFDVIDKLALAKARPDLCNIEPATALINTAIRGGLRECPGLANMREELQVIV